MLAKNRPPADKILLCYAIKYYQPSVRYNKPPICFQHGIISTIQPNKTLCHQTKRLILHCIHPSAPLCTNQSILCKTLPQKTPKTALDMRFQLVKRFTFPYKPRFAPFGYTYRHIPLNGVFAGQTGYFGTFGKHMFGVRVKHGYAKQNVCSIQQGVI